MTLILVLGFFVGLYVFWLMVRLATFAFPLYTGLGVAFWLFHHAYGYFDAILAGFVAGIVTLIASQLLFGLVRSPTLRFGLALLFVLPAGFAGYQMVRSLAGLMLSNGVLLTALGAIGGVFMARSAWVQLTTPSWSTPQQPVTV